MKKWLLHLLLCLVCAPAMTFAQTDTVNWQQFDLNGRRFKAGLVGMVDNKPVWPYIVGGGAAAGIGIFLLTRNDDDPLPVLIARDDQTTASCAAAVTVNVIANDTGEGITVTAVTQPAGATAAIASGGNIVVSDIGNTSFTFTYTITDRAGQTATATVSVSVSDNQAPVISCPPATTVPCGSSADPSITGNPTVSDNCTPTAQITVTFSDQTSDGQIARTWTATDQAGNAASCIQTITFVDEQAPVISCPPATTVPCGSSADPSITGNPTVSDNCTPTAQITVTFSDQTSDGQICPHLDGDRSSGQRGLLYPDHYFRR
jgi:hypothetical protein